ncbi:MAG: hypothetical protein ACREDH_03890 [Methylocella sp.]
MTLDGFLTFLTLIIAVYAVVPGVTRLRYQLRIIWPLIISVAGFLLVVYFEFGQPCPQAFGAYCCFLRITPESPINTGQAAFAVVIAWLFLSWIAFRRSKLSPHALPILSTLVSELAYKRRHAELIELIEPHLPLLDRSAQRQLKRARLHDYLFTLDHRKIRVSQLLDQVKNGKVSVAGPSLRSLRHRAGLAAATMASEFACLVPSQRRAEDAAQNIFRVLLHSPEIVAFVATFRPEFGVRLLSCSVPAVRDFCDAYLTALISDSRSILYTEIKQNQNLDSKTGYWFPQHNRLLHFLFKDARTAERLDVWEPLGEYAFSALRSGSNPGYVAFLNGPADSFSQDERWKDRTFAVVRFFDLMVTAAEYQGVQWHMGLYYFPRFIERIVAVYDASGIDIEQDAEWPTRAAYLIYEIFNALTRWVTAVRTLPTDSPHLMLENDEVIPENGNIPKSATLVLGMCLKTILLTPCISERFKCYIHGIVMRRMRDLNRNGIEARFRALLIKAIIQGGLPDNATNDYRTTLKNLFSGDDLNDYQTSLDQVSP